MSYNPKRASLIAYLNTKLGEQDWPAVSDAATDLSILDILHARSMAGTPRLRDVSGTTVSQDSVAAIGKLPARTDLYRSVQRE